MKLIVGLGNPGHEYRDTRHNIGYMVADKLAKELGAEAMSWQSFGDGLALIAKAGDVILLKPLTFMNASGTAVAKAVRFYKIEPSDVWIIHDDIDLPLGKVRIRQGGGSGGHNGIESVIQELGSDAFLRMRLGIGRGKTAAAKHTDRNLHHRSVIDFVLSRFRESEAGEMRKLIKYGVDAVRLALRKGTDKAMNRFN